MNIFEITPYSIGNGTDTGRADGREKRPRAGPKQSRRRFFELQRRMTFLIVREGE
ncbi:MAG: hypothetical protein RLO50_12655 [Azospirillaceae bacterium]